MPQADIAIVGGSGLYELDGLQNLETVSVQTPYGYPSDEMRIGTIEGVRIVFLPRHGRGHRLLPSEIPSRANMYAFRQLGVRRVVSASAVGSLRDDLRPMDMVVPDDLYDRTKGRPSTFFGEGIVAHVAFGHPFCPEVRAALGDASSAIIERTHIGGTYVCIEGPSFSTRAESQVYRSLGFDVVGMTALPEAKLAREAGLCYGILAQVTDYDSWHDAHDEVTNAMVMENVARNVANAKAIIRGALPALAASASCTCAHSLATAVATSTDATDASAYERVRWLFPAENDHR